jgi:BirA family biotin operon repressor/biotin-[acetyl-CoA-carboxylase] ligase
MDVAARLARYGAPDRALVVSAAQTAGRGRAGRVWQAPPGTSLFCTLILRPRVAPDRLSTLPLVTGVAVAEAIESLTGAPVALKWPNDVWIGADPVRRKAAGILTTSALHAGAIDHVLVGIGVNLTTSADALPPKATSLLAATGRNVAAEEMLDAIIARFDRVYAAFQHAAGRPPLDGWRSRAALLGERVTIEDAAGAHTGDFVGIDDDGALLLREPDQTVRKFVAGDMVRGPRPGD